MRYDKTYRITPWIRIGSVAVLAVMIVVLLASVDPSVASSQEIHERIEEVDEAEVVTEAELEAYEAELAAAEEEVALPLDPKTLRIQTYVAVRRAMIRRVCDLTPKQTKQLDQMDDKWFIELSKEIEKAGNAPAVQPGLIGMFFGVQARPARVVGNQNLKEEADKKLIAILTDEQKKQVDEAQKKADDFRHSATADALIEALQDRLDLTNQQRTTIKKKILPWVSRSDILVTYYFNGNNYYPDIPIHLLDSLTDEQRKAYLALQRHTWTSDNFHDGNQPIVIKE